jgi:hypothetical protein
MDPVFAATSRRLSDLSREHDRLIAGNLVLDILRNADVDEGVKRWVVNAALSAGVSGLYTGMEEILRGLLAAVDNYVPTGDRSHQEILDQASVPVDGVRPAILSQDVYDMLTDLKGFRHFERHNYRFRFDNTLVDENETRAENIVPLFVRDVLQFIDDMTPKPSSSETPGRSGPR